MKDDSKDSNDRAEERKENEEKGVDAAASDDSKLHAREPEDDEDEEEDDDEEDEEQAEARARATASPASRRSDKPRRKGKGAVPSRRPSRAPSAKAGGSSNVGIYVAVALVAGAAAGWFAREARGKQVSAEVHAASAAGEGPCEAWQTRVCESAGDQSAACSQAKNAAGVLSADTCSVALDDVPATLEKISAARADCGTLVSKLCSDLGEQTGTCKMVRERTESFPPERCKEMLGSFDKVLAQLQAMEQRGGPGGPHGGPPGASPHGGPPGASPHGGPPGAQRPTGNIQLNTGPARNVTPPPAQPAPPQPPPATP